MGYQVRSITPAEHVAFNASRPSVSFLQTPAWGEVKSEWGRESLGWFDDQNKLVGAGLVLHRKLPLPRRLNRLNRTLAYLPEGPVIDWESDDLGAWLDPLVAHLKRRAFAIRIGTPVVARRWGPATIKAALADPAIKKLSEAPADEINAAATRAYAQLRHLGWRPPQDEDGGFAAGQPRFNFQLPLAGKDEDQLLKGMNQLWRRNIKKAAKSGVVVTEGRAEDLPDFHRIYVETAERDHFPPRPLSYFQTMYGTLRAEDPDRIRLYLAHHDGDLVAGTTWVRVGEHAWYSFGASTTAKRDVRGSNAVQWRMITDAKAAGATVYDLRGITDTVDTEDPHAGLIQFKVGTGGEAVEYLGEWDLPLNSLIYKAFTVYMSRRG